MSAVVNGQRGRPGWAWVTLGGLLVQSRQAQRASIFAVLVSETLERALSFLISLKYVIVHRHRVALGGSGNMLPALNADPGIAGFPSFKQGTRPAMQSGLLSLPNLGPCNAVFSIFYST